MRGQRHLTWLGHVFAQCGAVSYGGMAILVSASCEKLRPEQLLLFRAIAAFTILSVVYRAKILTVFRIDAKFVWIRGLAGALAIFFYFANLKISQPGAATALHECSPLLVILWITLFHRKRPHILVVLGGVLAMVGVAIVSTKGGEIHRVNGLRIRFSWSRSRCSCLSKLEGICPPVFGWCDCLDAKRLSNWDYPACRSKARWSCNDRSWTACGSRGSLVSRPGFHHAFLFSTKRS